MKDLVAHYGLSIPTTTNWFIQTTETYFEIEDTNVGEIELHTTRGLGMGKISNQDALVITVINYDKFITSLIDESFKHGRKRCDIILNSSNQRYFILGEIKDKSLLTNKKIKNVRSEAKKQLIATLQTILVVKGIHAFVNQKEIKRCCYFNKQSASPDILNATIAFNRLPNLYPEGFQMSVLEFEVFGFDFFEYTGDQTMILTN